MEESLYTQTRVRPSSFLLIPTRKYHRAAGQRSADISLSFFSFLQVSVEETCSGALSLLNILSQSNSPSLQCLPSHSLCAVHSRNRQQGMERGELESWGDYSQPDTAFKMTAL